MKEFKIDVVGVQNRLDEMKPLVVEYLKLIDESFQILKDLPEDAWRGIASEAFLTRVKSDRYQEKYHAYGEALNEYIDILSGFLGQLSSSVNKHMARLS